MCVRRSDDTRRVPCREASRQALRGRRDTTAPVRLAGSSGATPFACIAAGIACLWGPAHGGANEAALNMLSEIGHADHIPEFIARAKDKNLALIHISEPTRPS